MTGSYHRGVEIGSLERGDRYCVPRTPGKRSGRPCIRGLRITVSDVLEYLASGMPEADILNDFSELTSEDMRACLAFAADREKRLAGSTA